MRIIPLGDDRRQTADKDERTGSIKSVQALVMKKKELRIFTRAVLVLCVANTGRDTFKA